MFVAVQKKLHLADCPYRAVGTGVVEFATLEQVRRYARRIGKGVCATCEKRMKEDAVSDR